MEMVFDSVTLEPLRYAIPGEKPAEGEMIATTAQVIKIKKTRMESIPHEQVSESMHAMAYDTRQDTDDTEESFLSGFVESPMYMWLYYRDNDGNPMRRVVNRIDWRIANMP